MSRKCDLTGKRPLVGNNVSHANNKTKMRQLPNLISKKFFVSELNRDVQLRVSKSALRTIDKLGIEAYLRKLGKSARSLI